MTEAEPKKGFFLSFGSFGQTAAALFLISVFSGVLLSLHYDPQQAYNSLVKILLYNPWASFWRNLHYWSSQGFLVLTIIHLWGYLRKKYFTVIPLLVWSRMVLGIFFMFFVMFTGFLLKGDNDSKQAALIFRSLLQAFPLGGKWLGFSILGKDSSLVLPYVHHIATATILLLLVIREHARKIWPGYRVFFFSLLPLALLSLFLIPSLHDGLDASVKGPWYFIGLQEFLHWINLPELIWTGVLLFLSMVFFLQLNHEKLSWWLRAGLLMISCFYLLLTFTGFLFRGAQWQWSFQTLKENSKHLPWLAFTLQDNTKGIILTDSLSGKESCLHCHDHFTGFSPGHQPDKVGCYSCHGGNKFTLNKNQAHRGMRLIPGNLEDAAQSCGTNTCHPDIIPRINQSLMTRLSGLIAVDHWLFGEIPTPDSLMDILHLPSGAASSHLLNLCLSCHLGGTKDNPGSVNELTRGGGCLACHLTYSREAGISLTRYLEGKYKGSFRQYVHPAIGKEVGTAHCFGCHSRSGRISASYEGWAETLDSPGKLNNGKAYRRLADGRWFTFAGDDVHHSLGMTCTDCHSVREVMGDENSHRHKEEAVRIRCQDCHPDGKPNTMAPGEVDYEAARMMRLWGLDTAGLLLKEKNSGFCIPGGKVRSDGSLSFLIRSSGKEMTLKRPAAVCTRGKAHKQLHCSACHTAWAPRCIACHTSFDPEAEGNNLFTGKKTRGKWREEVAGFTHSPPTLGVEMSRGKKIIRPVVPGMILSLDQSRYRGKQRRGEPFYRLYAPLEAHTTQKKGRSCQSCHSDPLALGYGEGILTYQKEGNKGRWSFEPAYENLKTDGLPADAWIPFLGEGKQPYATRLNVRPFDRKEQERILAVGACLTCHKEGSRVMTETLDDFQSVYKRAKASCLLPDFRQSRV